VKSLQKDVNINVCISSSVEYGVHCNVQLYICRIHDMDEVQFQATVGT
jgi:hypothetical protein